MKEVIFAGGEVKEVPGLNPRRSLFSVPGAGIWTKVEPYRDGAQLVGGDVSVGTWLPQNSPACSC